MSHATPFPGIPAHPPHSADLAARIQEFQAAMFRVHDCLQRIGSDPICLDSPQRGLAYIDRQLCLLASNCDAARFAVTAIHELTNEDFIDVDNAGLDVGEKSIATPDGSGRNAGGGL